jgi:hypothetical protein
METSIPIILPTDENDITKPPTTPTPTPTPSSIIDYTKNITLKYLGNNIFQEQLRVKLEEKEKEHQKEYEDDLKFYKKRIHRLFKEMYSNAKSSNSNTYPNETLSSLFTLYTREMIEYLKIIDRHDILQEEHTNTNTNTNELNETQTEQNQSQEIHESQSPSPLDYLYDFPKRVKATPTLLDNFVERIPSPSKSTNSIPNSNSNSQDLDKKRIKFNITDHQNTPLKEINIKTPIHRVKGVPPKKKSKPMETTQSTT